MIKLLLHSFSLSSPRRRGLRSHWKLWIPVFTGMIIGIAVFALGAKTAQAGGLIRPPNNLGLVGYWSMEDNGGTTVTDFSGKGNRGTMTNMEVADWVDGKRGKALAFDGSDEYVDAGSTAPFDSDNWTIHMWMYPISGGLSVQRPLAYFTDGPNFWLNAGSMTTVHSGTFDSGAVSFSVSNNEWASFTVTRSGSTYTAYKNGVQVFQNTSFAVTYTKTGSITVGVGNTSEYFKGYIDEVRIYSRALSATEVNTLYQQSSKITKVKPNSQNGLLMDGLIGFWSFNDADISGTTALDRSTLSNDGTINSATTGVVGKIGQAITFSGSSGSYVDMETTMTTTDTFTYAAWLKPSGSGIRSMIGGGTGFPQWRLMNGGAMALIKQSVTDVCTSSGTVSNGVWTHAVLVYNGGVCYFYINGTLNSSTANSQTFSAAAPDIGRPHAFDEFYNGSIDEFRVYNRALTTDEITKLYHGGQVTVNKSSAGAPGTANLVGWWTFDGADLNTTTSTDRSGQGNNGTLAGASGSQNKPQPVLGKVGQALRFDGTDDSASVSTYSGIPIGGNARTFSAWIKGSSAGLFNVVSMGNSNEVGQFFSLSVGNGVNKLFFWGGAANVQGNTTLDSNKWSLATVTYDGTNVILYLDGVVDGSGTPSLNTPSGYALNMGTNGFAGQIDDVRIYNKALSAAEVLALYNQGK